MIVFPCHTCQTALCAEEDQTGSLVRCPTCSATLKVPANRAPAREVETAGRAASSAFSREGVIGGTSTMTRPNANAFLGRSSGKRYGFNCAYCSSRLEATESMAAQEGQCPTCGNQITIPILDRYGRLIDPKTREVIKQAPHPVHAYAAAGDRAPAILRLKDGRQTIRCPRCSGQSPITANNCKACGMPFTMEGTTVEAGGSSNGFAVASLVLGIIGIPAACTIVLPVLAVIFGVIGMTQISNNEGEGGGRGMAVAGIVCGGIGCFVTLVYYYNRF